MRDLLPVLRVMGMLMVMFAISMLVPFGVSWFTEDGVWRIYPWSLGISACRLPQTVPSGRLNCVTA